jgi:hypothetical protein
LISISECNDPEEVIEHVDNAPMLSNHLSDIVGIAIDHELFSLTVYSLLDFNVFWIRDQGFYHFLQ